MPGKFLAFASVGEEAVHVVSVGSGERVLDAPDFLKHQVGALTQFRFFGRVTHTILQSVHPACKARAGQIRRSLPTAAAGLEWQRWQCAGNSNSTIHPFREPWRARYARHRGRHRLAANLNSGFASSTPWPRPSSPAV